MSLDQITRNGYFRTKALNDEAVNGLKRRAQRRMAELLDDTQRENEQLLRERRELQRQNDVAVELIRTLVDRNEAFRRLATHLRGSWQPTNPEELPLKTSLAPLLEQKQHELDRDPKWARQRDTEIAEHLCAPAVRPAPKTRQG